MLEELLINKIEQIISVGNLLESCAVADKKEKKEMHGSGVVLLVPL